MIFALISFICVIVYIRSYFPWETVQLKKLDEVLPKTVVLARELNELREELTNFDSTLETSYKVTSADMTSISVINNEMVVVSNDITQLDYELDAITNKKYYTIPFIKVRLSSEQKTQLSAFKNLNTLVGSSEVMASSSLQMVEKEMENKRNEELIGEIKEEIGSLFY